MLAYQKILILLCFSILFCCSPARQAVSFPESSTALGQEALRKQVISDGLSNDASDRVVLFDAYLSIETFNPDSIHQAVVKLSNALGGYILFSSQSKTSIRIPSKQLTPALTTVEKLGNVIEKNIVGKDVTEEFRDLEIRLDNREKARQRYLALLSQATDVSSALEIEKELERVVQDIDVIKGKLNRLSHLEQFATVTITTLEPRSEPRPGPLGYVFIGLYKTIKFLFVWD